MKDKDIARKKQSARKTYGVASQETEDNSGYVHLKSTSQGKASN